MIDNKKGVIYNRLKDNIIEGIYNKKEAIEYMKEVRDNMKNVNDKRGERQ